MLVYRVFPFLESARPGNPGHPQYEHRPQLVGRADHPDYYVWYLARQPEAAVGESFGNLAEWSDSMFEFPLIPGSRKSLGIFRLHDDLRTLDLDVPSQLVRLGLRPTQVVTRNLPVTQAWAHRIWTERDTQDTSRRRWDAIEWWSYHHPNWTILASWERPVLQEVVRLDCDNLAVRDAAEVLARIRR